MKFNRKSFDFFTKGLLTEEEREYLVERFYVESFDIEHKQIWEDSRGDAFIDIPIE